MNDAIKSIAINIVSGLAVAAIVAVSPIIWRYAVPKLKERFKLWKWRREVRNETERIEFKDFKNFETLELMSGPFRESISINDEDIFNEELRKPLKRKKINSRLKRTARKQKTNTVHFNVYKHINKNSNNK